MSGGTMRRPMLDEAMRRIEAGESEGLVVWRLDRLGRTLVGTLELIDRIDKRGAVFASVSDDFDISSHNGRLVLRIMPSIAQWELERIGASWAEAKARAVKRGIHVAGHVPTGYRREVVGETAKGKPIYAGPLLVDPVYGPLVRELFERRAMAESWVSLRRWLNETGIPTVRGGPWALSGLDAIINNPVYLGQARSGEFVQKDAHPALVDIATWNAAREARGARRGPQMRHSPLLRGLVRCGSCQYVMSFHKPHPRRERPKEANLYVCSRHASRDDCPAPSQITANGGRRVDGLDSLVVRRMFDRLREVRFQAVDDDLAEFQADVDAARAQLGDYLSDEDLRQTVGRAEFMAGAKSRQAAIDKAQRRLDHEMRSAQRPWIKRPVRELEAEWPSLSPEEQRAIVAGAVQAVYVRRGGARGRRTSDATLAKRSASTSSGSTIRPSTSPGRDDATGSRIPSPS